LGPRAPQSAPLVEDAEEEMRDLLGFDAYIEAMNALGISPRTISTERREGLLAGGKRLLTEYGHAVGP
jgi:hypothetical protein